MIYAVAIFIALFVGIMIAARRQGTALRRTVEARKSRNEAMFVSMFPELQPHFHPENLLKFVTQRRGRRPGAGVSSWDTVDGFPGLRARIANEPDDETYRLLDAEGKERAAFRYQEHVEGGILRVGKGKLTVRTVFKDNQRVSYWHPNREFKWSRRKGWVFVTPMADDSFSSSRDDRTSSFSSSDSSRSSAEAPFAGGGGTFDGGGASGGWDDGGKAETSTSY
ncbi:hypothetical protein BWI17_19800 [Betaproteobacteria bacterium GR16-43]|nr:hypothetical protein BWI17_19800 [Betaproteobacteria bacterium GR16-43]